MQKSLVDIEPMFVTNGSFAVGVVVTEYRFSHTLILHQRTGS